MKNKTLRQHSEGSSSSSNNNNSCCCCCYRIRRLGCIDDIQGLVFIYQRTNPRRQQPAQLLGRPIVVGEQILRERLKHMRSTDDRRHEEETQGDIQSSTCCVYLHIHLNPPLETLGLALGDRKSPLKPGELMLEAQAPYTPEQQQQQQQPRPATGGLLNGAAAAAAAIGIKGTSKRLLLLALQQLQQREEEQQEVAGEESHQLIVSSCGYQQGIHSSSKPRGLQPGSFR